jgi:hypothetical protein
MTDPNGLDLVALAPEVDPAASRALFDRRRARSRRRRRLGAGLAAAAVLAVGGAALAAGPVAGRPRHHRGVGALGGRAS